MAQIVKTQGFVLNTNPFKETSLFATIFTKQSGKLRVLAKGCRRPRSKMCGALERFNLIELIYYKRETKETYTVSDVTIIDDYNGIRQRPQAVNAALVLCEFFFRTLPAEDPDPRSYVLLEDYLDVLQTQRDTLIRQYVIIYLLRAISYAGVSPLLDSCVRCHHPLTYNGRRVDFSMSGGGVVCSSDHDSTVIRLSWDTLNTMRQIYKNTNPEMNNAVLTEIEHLLPDYLRYHLDGLVLNSLKQLLR